jgi:Fuc2NAc and GlcNAc transferase
MMGVLVVVGRDSGTSLAVALILLGVFVEDATTTLVRRVLRGDQWYSAHRSHAYQHLSRRLGSHAAATSAVLVVNILWLAPLAFFAANWPRWSALLVALALCPLVAVALWLGAGQREERR